MAKIKYKSINLGADRLAIVAQADQILEEYDAQGFVLTLRQLYYQFVARDLFPDDRQWAWTGAKWIRDPNGTKNADPNYKWLGDIINDARLAGLIDWAHMEDRTRNIRTLASWDSPASIVGACASQFKVDMWAKQKNRIEVWIEKDALVGVIEGVCNELRVPYFSCRGYTSQSEMWSAAQRHTAHTEGGQQVCILHLGDLDPSGVDMSRDIRDRLEMFCYGNCPEFTRLALGMKQVKQYRPPPNPAKSTDSRFLDFKKKYGDESWELDALDPKVIAALIRAAVAKYRDDRQWKKDAKVEEAMKQELIAAADRWPAVAEFLTD